MTAEHNNLRHSRHISAINQDLCLRLLSVRFEVLTAVWLNIQVFCYKTLKVKESRYRPGVAQRVPRI